MNDTHEKIIYAARTLFEKNGFASATTKEIAALAGVSEVTLFRHFENKRKLFEETIKSCMHSYQIDDYLKNKAVFDLECDLKWIAYHMMETFTKNVPMIRMVMRDKIRGSSHEMHVRHKEHHVKNQLFGYFVTMKEQGKLGVDPGMAITFFMTNVNGYIMRSLLPGIREDLDLQYFEWMIKQVITILKP